MPQPPAHNIIFDARMYHHSGIGSYIRNLVGQYVQQGISRDMVLLGDRDIPDHGLKTRHCHYKIYGLAEQTILPFSVRAASLFHAPHYNAPVLFPGKLVVTIHDLIHLNFYNQLPTMLHKLYAKIMMGIVVNRADAIMTDSDWTRNDILRRWPQAESKIKTVYCGVSEPIEHPSPKTVLDRYGVNKPYILYLGLLKRHKNIIRLVKSFETAQRSLKGKYQLVIAGDAKSDDTGLKQYVDGCAAKHLIRLTGFVPGADLPALYGQAAVFAFPSTAEGFGLPPLEAMSYGVPVISSNATCLPEILKDAPLYFDPFNTDDMAACLERAVRNESWRRQAVEKGRSVAAGYRWENTARECLDVYRSLI
jgi:glycosyltransferase involved in cell wall biosynthesis